MALLAVMSVLDGIELMAVISEATTEGVGSTADITALAIDIVLETGAGIDGVLEVIIPTLGVALNIGAVLAIGAPAVVAITAGAVADSLAP